MKQRISISVDEETLAQLQESLRKNKRSGIFRNKSHLIEYSIKKLIEEEHGR
ncbi:MAG: hypothetical protein O2779_02545 [Nanoarchaeota archaeon]|nr:hypothetical protein [Nanoarchaeota archaeon]